MIERPAIIEYDLATAERELRKVWQDYQQTEKYGLKFGEKCCEWRDKLGAKGKRMKGDGVIPILEQLKIPVSTAYWWMNRYEESIGARAPHVSHNSGNNEWYTPPEYLEAARQVMGNIDLDPASNDIAQETVQASEFFDKETDGLAQDWKGRVWLNPPYSQPLIQQFIEKLLAELKSGDVREAILLTNNATDTAWFHKAEKVARCICFTLGRISFQSHEGGYPPGSPLQGNTFFYFGEDEESFRNGFSNFGFIR